MTRGVALERFEPGHLLRQAHTFCLPDFMKPEPVESDAEETTSVMPEAEQRELAIEAERVAKEDLVFRLESLIAQINETWRLEIDAELKRVSNQACRSVDALLPGLLTEFSAAQIASSVLAVVETANLQSPVLYLATDDYEGVIAEISDADTHVRIEIRKSEDQDCGTAFLRWENGGADLNLDDFLTAAKRVIRTDADMIQDGENQP